MIKQTMTEEQLEKRREARRLYYKKNKEKELQRNREWAAKNKSKKRIYQQTYRTRHREKAKELNRKYKLVENMTPLQLEKVRDQKKVAARKWYQNNKEKSRAYKAIYSCQKIKAIPGWFEQEQDLIQIMYEKAGQFGFSVDHIVPLRSDRVCGLHTWANLQLLDSQLNLSKGNREWPDMP